MAHVDRYINEQFDLSQTNLAGAVADRQLGQGGQVACEDTWNTTVDDQTPVRSAFYWSNKLGFWLVEKLGFWLAKKLSFWFVDVTYNYFLEIKWKEEQPIAAE